MPVEGYYRSVCLGVFSRLGVKEITGKQLDEFAIPSLPGGILAFWAAVDSLVQEGRIQYDPTKDVYRLNNST